MSIAFAVTVTTRDWDDNLGAWRCPALRIPGATVEALFDRGARVDSSWYEPLPDHGLLRWVRGAEVPSEATAFLKLTQELSTKDLTARWKKLAIVLPVFATLVSASITGAITYRASGNRAAKTGNEGGQTHPPTSSQKPMEKKGAVTTSQITDFSVMMPRGLRVIVLWPNAPKGDEAENALRQDGINVSEVDNGLKQAYAALSRRSSESIRFQPLIFVGKDGEISFLPGYGHAVARGGPAPDSMFQEFQLFQDKDAFKILIHLRKPGGPVDPTKIGIDWNAVRMGLMTTLQALYKNTKEIALENVGIYTEADGDWSYLLPYRIRDRQ